MQAKVPGMNEALEALRIQNKGLAKKLVYRLGHKGHKETVVPEGQAGNPADGEGGEVLPDVQSENDEPHPPHEHETDDQEFDYLAYARDRAMFFWGDMLELGLVKEADLPADVARGAKRVPY